MVERGADLEFEPVHLVDDGGRVGAHLPGRCADTVAGHGLPEALQALPAVQAAFDGAADVAWYVVAEGGDHLRPAVDAFGPTGDLVAAGGGDDGHDAEVEFGGDVGVGPAGVLVAQPLRVDGGGLPGVGQGDAVVAGAGDQVRARDPGLGLDLVEGLPRGGVLAVEELAGQQGACAILPFSPGGSRDLSWAGC